MKIDYVKSINYALIGYAFMLPLSKAGVNLFESFIFLFWVLEGQWEKKFLLLRKNSLSISIILLILISTLTLPYARDISFGASYILKYRHFLIILIIFTALDRKYLNYIFSGFLLGMFFSEIVSYGIFFEWWQYKNILPNDPSPFMSHTDYSIYLAFTSMILLNRIFDKSYKLKNRIFYLLFFITSTSNLFTNGGRTGQVVFFIVLSIGFIMSIKKRLIAVVSLIVVGSTILTFSYQFSPVFHQRVLYTQNEVSNMITKNDYRGAFSQRVALWQMGLNNFEDNFILGTGIGNDMKSLKYYTEKFNFDYDIFKGFKKSDNHNTFLTLSIQLGIMGLFIISFIFYSLFTLKFKTLNFRILHITFFVTFFLWSMGGITFHTMNPMIFFALFAGIFNKVSYIETKDDPLMVPM